MIMRLKHLLVVALGIVLAANAGPPSRAGDAPVVVELFTSQGCRACPPADATLGLLARRDDIIALSLHVDYWDYLGWRDTFAHPAFSERQFAYRDNWGESVVYTPQLIVHGRRDVRADDMQAITAAIANLGDDEAPITVRIERRDGMLKCRIEPRAENVTGTVWIAKYLLRTSVEIPRGENAGRTITYYNVVISLDRIGAWSGTEPEEVTMPQPAPGEGVAVWIQEGRAGPILAAAKIENPE